jgi:hypothetical protein
MPKRIKPLAVAWLKIGAVVLEKQRELAVMAMKLPIENKKVMASFEKWYSAVNSLEHYFETDAIIDIAHSSRPSS